MCLPTSLTLAGEKLALYLRDALESSCPCMRLMFYLVERRAQNLLESRVQGLDAELPCDDSCSWGDKCLSAYLGMSSVLASNVYETQSERAQASTPCATCSNTNRITHEG